MPYWLTWISGGVADGARASSETVVIASKNPRSLPKIVSSLPKMFVIYANEPSGPSVIHIIVADEAIMPAKTPRSLPILRGRLAETKNTGPERVRAATNPACKLPKTPIIAAERTHIAAERTHIAAEWAHIAAETVIGGV